MLFFLAAKIVKKEIIVNRLNLLPQNIAYFNILSYIYNSKATTLKTKTYYGKI